MPTVSVITAVSESTLAYLDEAWSTVQNLKLPAGWKLEWCVQHDGDSLEILRDWFGDSRVSYEYNGRWLRTAATRNMALMRAVGEYILPFDADDLLMPDAIVALARGFRSSEVAWSAGAWDKLHDDGSIVAFRHPSFEGVLDVGWVYNAIMERGTMPFVMNSVLYRRSAVVQAGGWPGFAEWEDSILLTAISGRYKGWTTGELIGLYRIHAGSTTTSNFFKDSKPKMYTYLKEVGVLQGWNLALGPVESPYEQLDIVAVPIARARKHRRH